VADKTYFSLIYIQDNHASNQNIYVDSRYKSGDSASDSNFYIDLPINLMMPDNTGFYINDVAVPVSWYPIDEGRNDMFYFKVGNVVLQKKVTPGNYSLVTLNEELVAQMAAAGFTDYFVSAPNVSKNTIRIVGTTTTSFEILTDKQIQALNFDSSATVNNILRNFTAKVNSNTSPYESGYVDLFPIRNLYLSCSGLGNFSTMSVSGERSIVKKISVNAGYGEMIFDQSVVGTDYLDCSHQTLSRIGFQLKDVFGRVVDLHGNHFSFSIVVSRISEIQ
jgi:hypothetical protein